jgi:hypothetical protein
VPQQFLDRPYVRPCLERVCGKAMPERMAAHK